MVMQIPVTSKRYVDIPTTAKSPSPGFPLSNLSPSLVDAQPDFGEPFADTPFEVIQTAYRGSIQNTWPVY